MRAFVGRGDVRKISDDLFASHFWVPKRGQNATVPNGFRRALTHLSNELKMDPIRLIMRELRAFHSHHAISIDLRPRSRNDDRRLLACFRATRRPQNEKSPDLF